MNEFGILLLYLYIYYKTISIVKLLLLKLRIYFIADLDDPIIQLSVNELECIRFDFVVRHNLLIHMIFNAFSFSHFINITTPQI